MNPLNATRALVHLFNALEHAVGACARTRHMLIVAIAKLRALLAIDTAALA